MSGAQRLLADVNGDGRADIIGFGNKGVQVALSTETGFTPARIWSTDFLGGNWSKPESRIFVADANGDGRTDIIGFGKAGVQVSLSKGDGFQRQPVIPNFAITQGWGNAPRLVADVDGDHLADLVGFKGWGPQAGVYVALASREKPGTYGPPSLWSADFTDAHGWLDRIRVLADVNGDRRADLVGISRTQVLVALSTGHGFDRASFAALSGFSPEQGWSDESPRLVVDVNGDGMSDIVGFGKATMVSLSTGKGFTPPTEWSSDFGSTTGWNSNTPRTMADVNGDGRMDVVGFAKDGVHVGLSADQRFTTATWQKLEAFGISQGWSSFEEAPRIMGDVNGDGLDDIVGFGTSQLQYALSSDGPADLLTSVTDGLGGRHSFQYLPLTNASVYQCTGTSALGQLQPGGASLADRGVTVLRSQSLLGNRQQVVASMSVDNDQSLNASRYSSTHGYSYADAEIDLMGRGWLGFKTRKLLNIRTGMMQVDTYLQPFPFTGRKSSSQRECGADSSRFDGRCTQAGLVIGANSITWSTVKSQDGVLPGQPVVEVRQTASRTDHYTYGRYDYSIGETYEYDSFGNLILLSQLNYVNRNGMDKQSSDNVYTMSTYTQPVDGTWRSGHGHLLSRKVSSQSTGEPNTFNPAVDFSLRTYQYTEDGRRNLSLERQWDSNNKVFLTFYYEYDAFGNRTHIREPDGSTTIIAYEDSYNYYQESVTSPPNADGTLLVVRYGHDPRDGSQTWVIDGNGRLSLSCVDDFDRTVRTQGSLPATPAKVRADASCLSPLSTGAASLRDISVITFTQQEWQADRQGMVSRRTRTLQSWPIEGSHPEWTTDSEYLDGQGRVYKSTWREGTPAESLVERTFDDAGRVLTETMPRLMAMAASARTKQRTYDIYGRLVLDSSPSGADGNAASVTTWLYDGSRLIVTEGEGSTQPYQKILDHQNFNGEDRLSAMTIPNDGNAVTVYKYDLLGRLVSVTDPPTTSNPKGVTVTYQLDSLDRLVTSNDPDRNTTGRPTVSALKRTYDPLSGRLSSETNAAGEIISYSYDKLGRLKSRTGTGATTTTYSFNYDEQGVPNGAGRVTSVVQTVNDVVQSTTRYTYDVYGNPTSTNVRFQQEDILTITSLHDPLGRWTSRSYPGAHTATRSYVNGLLASQKVGSATVSYAQYSARGKPEFVGLGNAAIISYAYAPSGVLNTTTVTRATGGKDATLLALSYEWDPLNRPTALHDRVAGDGKGLSQSFTYSNSRLSQAVGGLYGSRSYDYDASGNFISKDGVMYSYVAHRVTQGTIAGRRVFGADYDEAGRTRSRTVDALTWSYEYDGFGRLVAVNKEGRNASHFFYGADDLRLRKLDADGATTTYVTTDFEVMDKAGARSYRIYLRDAEGTAAVVEAGDNGSASTQYFARDHQGGTLLALDSQGRVTSRVGYDPYGALHSISGTADFRPKGEGRELDSSTELYDFGARQYDPLTGRFLTPDSELGATNTLQADVFNRFAFELNSPLAHIDRDGHRADSITNSITQSVISAILVAGGVLLTCASEGTLAPVLGAALLGAGTQSLSYSLPHAISGTESSWASWGINMGFGAAAGAVSGGFGALTENMATFLRVPISAIGGAASSVVGQIGSNVAEGKTFSNGLLTAGLVGAGVGGISNFTFGRKSGSLAGKLMAGVGFGVLGTAGVAGIEYWANDKRLDSGFWVGMGIQTLTGAVSGYSGHKSALSRARRTQVAPEPIGSPRPGPGAGGWVELIPLNQ